MCVGCDSLVLCFLFFFSFFFFLPLYHLPPSSHSTFTIPSILPSFFLHFIHFFSFFSLLPVFLLCSFCLHPFFILLFPPYPFLYYHVSSPFSLFLLFSPPLFSSPLSLPNSCPLSSFTAIYYLPLSFLLSIISSSFAPSLPPSLPPFIRASSVFLSQCTPLPPTAPHPPSPPRTTGGETSLDIPRALHRVENIRGHIVRGGPVGDAGIDIA